jgi:predicted dehydrogenase
MPAAQPTRWGIAGTAGIARSAFLPAVRATGGVAAAVASRDLARAQEFAAAAGIDRALPGYQALIEDSGIDAVYLPLPNGLHAEWTIAALRAGKPVLCEKPLCGTVAQTEEVLAIAARTGTLLWEAIAFVFGGQHAALRELVGRGTIGELREIQSTFQVELDRPDDIRMSRELAGGAVQDLGVYPIRLARELFGAEHDSAWAAAEWGGDGVDVDLQGSLGFPGGRRLLLSCGFGRAFDTFSRLMGTRGQINVSDPFVPGPQDYFEIRADGQEPRRYPADPGAPLFAAMVGHIQAVLAGEEAPRLLAKDTALGSAQAVADLLADTADE